MRELNEKEKSIIKKLVEAKGTKESAIIGLIDEYINVYVVRWDDVYSKLEICGHKDIDIIDRYNALLELIFLLDYLRSNRYISIYNFSIKIENSIHHKKYKIVEREDGTISAIIRKDEGCDTYFTDIKSFIVYTDLGRKISLYAKSAFFVSENLRDFVKNDFKTQEQLRFEKQMKTAKDTLCWTQWALFVALLPSFVALIKFIYDMELQKMAFIVTSMIGNSH